MGLEWTNRANCVVLTAVVALETADFVFAAGSVLAVVIKVPVVFQNLAKRYW